MSDRTRGALNSKINELKSKVEYLSKTKITGKVFEVILDEENKLIEEFLSSDNETKDTTILSYAIIRRTDDLDSNSNVLKAYPPMFPDEGVPLRGETVELIDVNGRLHYKKLTNPNINLGNTTTSKHYDKKEGGIGGGSSYGEVSSTKTPSGGPSVEDLKIPGEYFTEQQIHPLKLYEGDRIIQSRFGQSIRFSGYNNEENSFAPTILIRNRQNSEIEANEKPGKIIEEDINKEGSVILLTSGDYEIDLKPGTIDDGGSQQLETKPNKFEEYPTELKGNDQILINSERIILSSKSKEMIFFSKGNYGFISDGKFSIDNGNAGAELDFNGEFRMTMNDNPTYLLGQGTSGKIFLNIEEETEPLVRGETLKTLLTALIDEILKMVWATPAGPTSPGPLPPHVQKLNEIKTDLQSMLSTTNFTE